MKQKKINVKVLFDYPTIEGMIYKDTKIKVSKNNFSNSNKSTPINNFDKTSEPSKLSNKDSGIEIKSPIIGTAYLAPEPGAKKFVEVGDKIKNGSNIERNNKKSAQSS